VLFLVLGWYYKQNYAPFISILPPSFYFILTGLVGSLFWALVFQKYVNIKRSVLEHFSRITLGVYVVHLLFCYIATVEFNQCVEYLGRVCGVFTLFLFMVLISSLMCSFINRNQYLSFII